MKLGTWLAVFILGPGALGLFIWFLCDLKRIFGRDGKEEERAGE